MPFVIKKIIIIILIVWGVKQNVAEELFVVAIVNMYMCIWKYYWYCLRLNI